MMGYAVLGFAFGLLLVSFDYPWYLAPIMSLFIYAGALQFVAINFFVAFVINYSTHHFSAVLLLYIFYIFLNAWA